MLSLPRPAAPFALFASLGTLYAASPSSPGIASSLQLLSPFSHMALKLSLQILDRPVMWTPYRWPLTKLVVKLAASSAPLLPTLFINWWLFPPSITNYVINYVSFLPDFFGLLRLTHYKYPVSFEALRAPHIFFLFLLFILPGPCWQTLLSPLCLPRFLMKQYGCIPISFRPLYPPLSLRNSALLSPSSLLLSLLWYILLPPILLLFSL